MDQLKTILYATDLSSEDDPALRHAAFLARKGQGRLHLLHVFEFGDDPQLAHWRQTHYLKSIESCVRKLTYDEMARQIESAGAQDLVVVKAQRSGHPIAAQILDHADLIEADIIVMGTHGRRGIRRLFQGSVATQVLHHATCQVLIVRQGVETSPAESTHHILVPVDIAKPAVEAVARGKELAAQYDANLQLLYVVESNPHPHPLDPPIDPDEWANRIRPEALDQLRRIAAEAGGPDVKFTVDVTLGPVRSEIASFAEDHHSDLIVMMRHGHSGVIPSLSRGLTETVVRGAPCPVFTIKSA